jgi:hypothetical protein
MFSATGTGFFVSAKACEERGAERTHVREHRATSNNAGRRKKDKPATGAGFFFAGAVQTTE